MRQKTLGTLAAIVFLSAISMAAGRLAQVFAQQVGPGGVPGVISTLMYAGTVAAGGNLVTGQHISVGGLAPKIAEGPGAGTNATVSIVANSTDSTGWMNVTTGTKPEASAVIATITAANPVTKGSSWSCGVAAANDKAAALAVSAIPYVPMPAASVSAFTVIAGKDNLAASTTYVWSYWCVEVQ